MIDKRFPAETTLEIKTFLNDPKVDSELYAYFISSSKGEEGETRVYKNNIPTQEQMGKIMGKSRRTIINHLNYLRDTGYVIDKDGYYLLPKVEKQYFMIPLDTLDYLLHTVKENVLKVYIYLGQRWKWKGSEYEFTLDELGKHVGFKINNNQNIYKHLNDILDCLEKLGLVNYCSYYNGQSKKKRLLNFSLNVKREEK